MKETTLCYLLRGEEVLLLHRVKKQQDVNEGKWIGVGGKLEPGESPEECLCREVREETGYRLRSWQSRGIVYFYSDCAESETMYLYTASEFHGEEKECDEGVLAWVPWEQMWNLPMWEGDKVFLKLLPENRPFFRLELHYHGDSLEKAILDEKIIPLD